MKYKNNVSKGHWFQWNQLNIKGNEEEIKRFTNGGVRAVVASIEGARDVYVPLYNGRNEWSKEEDTMIIFTFHINLNTWEYSTSVF